MGCRMDYRAFCEIPYGFSHDSIGKDSNRYDDAYAFS